MITSVDVTVDECLARRTGTSRIAWTRSSPHSSTACSKFVVPVWVPILSDGVRGDVLRRLEPVLVVAHQQALFDGDVAVGEVDDLGPLVVDRDAVGCCVVLTIGNGLDHAVPRGFLVLGLQLSNSQIASHAVVVPTRAFAALSGSMKLNGR